MAQPTEAGRDCTAGAQTEFTPHGLPVRQGLYDPANERDACGIGFVANIKGEKSHDIILKGIQILVNLTHRGACGCDPKPVTAPAS